MLHDTYRNVNDKPGYDDPVWAHLLRARLHVYLEAVRNWWAELELLRPLGTGVYSVHDAPPGLMYRFTAVATHSPIKGIQAFPFVPVNYLYLTGIQGGVSKMVTRMCKLQTLTLDEFTIVCKDNLPATYNRGQILAFIPTVLLDDVTQYGMWLYFKRSELQALAEALDNMPKLSTIKSKVIACL
jgi:hypothetical protein